MVSRLFSLSLGNRLLVTSSLALLISAVLIVAILYVDARLERRGSTTLAFVIARLPLPAALTAVLYMEALFVTGYLGYLGPANVAWFVGIPAAATILAFRGKIRRSAIIFPAVMILGLLATVTLSAITGLPLD